jgi:hypothetical protein
VGPRHHGSSRPPLRVGALFVWRQLVLYSWDLYGRHDLEVAPHVGFELDRGVLQMVRVCSFVLLLWEVFFSEGF